MIHNPAAWPEKKDLVQGDEMPGKLAEIMRKVLARQTFAIAQKSDRWD